MLSDLPWWHAFSTLGVGWACLEELRDPWTVHYVSWREASLLRTSLWKRLRSPARSRAEPQNALWCYACLPHLAEPAAAPRCPRS